MDPQRSVPKGRGALLAALAQKKREEQQRPGPAAAEDTPPPEPPKPKGRAALLLAKREQLAAASAPAGASTSPRTEEFVFAEKAPTTPPKPPTEAMQKVTVSTPEKKGRQLVGDSQTPDQPTSYKGESGKYIPLNANYIRLEVERGKGVFEYHLDFEPSVDAKYVRRKVLAVCMEEMGKIRNFDGGSCVYLPIRLPQDVRVFKCEHPIDASPIQMTVTYKKQKKMADCIHLFNVLFKRVMHALEYKLMGRNHFDTKNVHMIPQHRLEVLPGFAVAVDEYEGGLMVCLDVQHRVLRTETALQLMSSIMSGPNRQRLTEEMTKALVGSIVLTKYNNNTYRVDDILWDVHPNNTFKTRDGSEITFSDYYKRQYGLDISSVNQPMLLHIQKCKTSQTAEETDRHICLVPEFCWLTGMTDVMRADFKVMRDVAQFTRITPVQRKHALETYLRSVNGSPDAQRILGEWGIRIAGGVIDLDARIIPAETVVFGRGGLVSTERGADWSNAQQKQACLQAIDLCDWAIVHMERDAQLAKDLSTNFVHFSKTMGCRITPARLYGIKNDRSGTYLAAAQECIRPNVQAIVFIFGSQREDLYAAVKKLCCCTSPIASQVVLARNLSNVKKSRTVTVKLALQINCKLGGALWTLKFPCKSWMICGVDVYHSPREKNSVVGFVASSNATVSCWFSQTDLQNREISDLLRMMFMRAMEHWRKINGEFPTQVVIFRDSVGEGQFEYCKRHEVTQFEEVVRDLSIPSCPVTVVIVQKRINTRLIMPAQGQGTGNPPPGAIVDGTITRRYLHDFFLVPQSVTQGTVTPTHYVVINDPAHHKPDHIQRLAFKLCHMYYNWSGTIRVPAPCQYAHKLAGLVGQYLTRAPHDSLRDKLYYL